MKTFVIINVRFVDFMCVNSKMASNNCCFDATHILSYFKDNDSYILDMTIVVVMLSIALLSYSTRRKFSHFIDDG